MDDLISRQAALNCFHDWVDKYGDVHTADEDPEYRALENLPIIEHPEIIHCKDCKHYNIYENHEKINDGDKLYDGWCMRWSGIEDMNDDDFCSYGERGES